MRHGSRIGRAALAVSLVTAILSGGCIAPYSRVGSTAHRKLYRATVEDVASATERAFRNYGYEAPTRVTSDGIVTVEASRATSRRVAASLRAREGGLVEFELQGGLEWVEEAHVHRMVAEELGLLARRIP